MPVSGSSARARRKRGDPRPCLAAAALVVRDDEQFVRSPMRSSPRSQRAIMLALTSSRVSQCCLGHAERQATVSGSAGSSARPSTASRNPLVSRRTLQYRPYAPRPASKAYADPFGRLGRRLSVGFQRMAVRSQAPSNEIELDPTWLSPIRTFGGPLRTGSDRGRVGFDISR
jgi:hypothetical protein